MNWIDRLFGKKEQLSPEIGFEELAEWVEERFSKIYGEVGMHAGSVYSDINAALGDIKKSASLLEKAQPEGRYHLKMVKIAASNRDNMVKQVRMLIENITVPDSTDARTIVSFHENAMQSLTVCLENMLKSYQYTKVVFLEDSKKVIAEVNALGRLLNRLIEPLNERKNTLSALENTRNIIKNIKNLSSDIEGEKVSIKENEEKILLLKKELEEKQRALERLKDSEPWKQYMDCRDELAQLENSAMRTESEINAAVLPLNKALTRLRQLDESGRYAVAAHVRKELELCLSDPKSADPMFFDEFRNIVESDALNLPPEKRVKTLEQSRLAASAFDLYKKQYQKLVQDIEMKKKELSGLNVEREETGLTGSITDLQDKLDTAIKELEASKKLIGSIEQSMEAKKQELQQTVALIESRARVKFDEKTG